MTCSLNGKLSYFYDHCIVILHNYTFSDFSLDFQKGILRRYADLHRNAIDTARDGAAFLAWHRVFLAMSV